MPTRRNVLGILAGSAVLPAVTARAAERVVRIGVLPFGTLGWEVETIRSRGFDRAHGIRLEAMKLASNDAARIAFQSGAIDTFVSDLLLAARVRSEGPAVKYLPFSKTEGAVMVPASSPIRSVLDLKGKKIGVAGGALDKAWIMLQAQARQEGGIDLAKESTPAYGAPPLLAEKLETGELDAAYLYWNFSVRLEAKGFRRLVGVSDMARALGAREDVALLGYLCSEDLGRDASAMASLAAASRDAKALLASSDEAWTAIRPLMQAPDEATFATLKRAFIEGIPDRPVPEERRNAEALFAILARLGGERLVGASLTLPADLYWDGAGNG